MDFKLVGKTTFNRKTYTDKDIKGIVNSSELGLPDSFYGGTCKILGVSSIKGLYLVLDEYMNVKDILIEDDKKKTDK